MPYYRFNETDVFYNRIKAHPKKEFFIYNSKIYLDNQSQISGAFTGSIPNVPVGHANLYEINVDRAPSPTGRTIGPSSVFPHREVADTGIIYPYITKNGSLSTFRTITTASFNEDFQYGDIVSGSYPLSASITRFLHTASLVRSGTANEINSLRTPLDYYAPISRHYLFSSSLGDKETQAINLINVPSIFYGSSIRKGSVHLKFYITGSLIGELKDENFNGELIQVGPTDSNGSGSTAGVVLYNEGFVLLTGSWSIGDATLDYVDDGSPVASSWLYYGVGANDSTGSDGHGANSRLSASYNMEFKGTQLSPVVTMLAHAPRGELNYSNNPTFLDQSQNTAFSYFSSSNAYVESANQPIKNIVKTPYNGFTGSYEPQTYISKIGIFDHNKNLIGIAKVATPVKKTEERELTFKLKLDF
tara:strand:- start:119 stop:1369 length:1251 start_codon:yes stop_codon:yes gene_type:complete